MQFLIYDTDPFDVDASNVAKVINYVVAYACKGNEREIKKNKI